MSRIAAILILLCLVAPGFGQPATTTLEQRVADLSAQIAAQQQQIQKLQQDQLQLLQELKAARPEQTAEAPVAEASAPTMEQKSETPSSVRAAHYPDWRDAGEGIQLGDKVKVGGYGSFRFEANDVASGNNIASGSNAGFTFRRFVMTTDAKPAKRLRVYSEIEYERLHGIEVEKSASFDGSKLEFEHAVEGRGELALEQAWGQFNFAENHGLRGGVVLAPVGRYNLLHDDDYWDIPRRTLTDRDAPILPVKSAWRDLGAGFVGSFNVGAAGKLDYQIYALNGAAIDFNIENEAEIETGTPGEAAAVFKSSMGLSSGFFDGSKGTSAVAWRAAYSPNLHGEFAFSGYHGNYAPSFLNFRENVTSLAYDHKWRWKGFETEAEFVHTSMGNLNNVLGAYATSIFNSANESALTTGGGGLTKLEVEAELSNLAKTKYGFWSDFKYHARPKWLKESFLGRSFEDPQLIPIFRYERVWLNDLTDDIEVTSGTVTGMAQEDLSQDRFTLGLSFRPARQFAIQAAYEHNRKLEGSRLIFPAVNQDATHGFIMGMAFSF